MQEPSGTWRALTGLDRLLDRDPARLSGGELRRLAIGCAVITGPAVLVLDEPFASLDADGAAALTALVRNLVAGGTAVVVLSQAMDAAAARRGPGWIAAGTAGALQLAAAAAGCNLAAVAGARGAAGVG